jgi:hypothetical protein
VPCWYPQALFTLEPFPTRLLAYWRSGQEEPRLLTTNLLHAQTTLRAYRLRMWVEEMLVTGKATASISSAYDCVMCPVSPD